MSYVKRGEIYLADLGPVVGSEQGGNRPVLVIQNDIGNQRSPTVIVASITSQIRSKSKLPTHCHIKSFDSAGLMTNSMVLLEQVRTIDKSRLGQRLGALTSEQMNGVNTATRISLGIN